MSASLTVASGATFALNNFNFAAQALAGTGNVTLGSGTLTVGATHADSTFSGAIES